MDTVKKHDNVDLYELFERADRAHLSTRRMDFRKTIDENDKTAPDTCYKAQLLQAQQALLSSREVANMKYDKMERKMATLTSELVDARTSRDDVDQLKKVIVDLKLEIAMVREKLDKQELSKRTVCEERNQLSMELEKADKLKNEIVKELMTENNMLRNYVKKFAKERKHHGAQEDLRDRLQKQRSQKDVCNRSRKDTRNQSRKDFFNQSQKELFEQSQKDLFEQSRQDLCNVELECTKADTIYWI